jgi:hypothetical protein
VSPSLHFRVRESKEFVMGRLNGNIENPDTP